MRLPWSLLIFALPLALAAACADDPSSPSSSEGGTSTGSDGARGGSERGDEASLGGDESRGGRGEPLGGAQQLEGGRPERPGTDGGADSVGGTGTSGDTGADPQGGKGGDTDPPTPTTINGCATFVDRTADGASRTLPWNEDLIYEPARCMQVRVGQSVTFDGDLDNHPMVPSGGDMPSPVGGAVATFTAPGTYGYRCIPHPAEMNGAIHVVP